MNIGDVVQLKTASRSFWCVVDAVNIDDIILVNNLKTFYKCSNNKIVDLYSYQDKSIDDALELKGTNIEILSTEKRIAHRSTQYDNIDLAITPNGVFPFESYFAQKAGYLDDYIDYLTFPSESTYILQNVSAGLEEQLEEDDDVELESNDMYVQYLSETQQLAELYKAFYKKGASKTETYSHQLVDILREMNKPSEKSFVFAEAYTPIIQTRRVKHKKKDDSFASNIKAINFYSLLRELKEQQQKNNNIIIRTPQTISEQKRWLDQMLVYIAEPKQSIIAHHSCIEMTPDTRTHMRTIYSRNKKVEISGKKICTNSRVHVQSIEVLDCTYQTKLIDAEKFDFKFHTDYIPQHSMLAWRSLDAFENELTRFGITWDDLTIDQVALFKKHLTNAHSVVKKLRSENPKSMRKEISPWEQFKNIHDPIEQADKRLKYIQNELIIPNMSYLQRSSHREHFYLDKHYRKTNIALHWGLKCQAVNNINMTRRLVALYGIREPGTDLIVSKIDGDFLAYADPVYEAHISESGQIIAHSEPIFRRAEEVDILTFAVDLAKNDKEERHAQAIAKYLILLANTCKVSLSPDTANEMIEDAFNVINSATANATDPKINDILQIERFLNNLERVGASVDDRIAIANNFEQLLSKVMEPDVVKKRIQYFKSDRDVRIIKKALLGKLKGLKGDSTSEKPDVSFNSAACIASRFYIHIELFPHNNIYDSQTTKIDKVLFIAKHLIASNNPSKLQKLQKEIIELIDNVWMKRANIANALVLRYKTTPRSELVQSSSKTSAFGNGKIVTPRHLHTFATQQHRQQSLPALPPRLGESKTIDDDIQFSSKQSEEMSNETNIKYVNRLYSYVRTILNMQISKSLLSKLKKRHISYIPPDLGKIHEDMLKKKSDEELKEYSKYILKSMKTSTDFFKPIKSALESDIKYDACKILDFIVLGNELSEAWKYDIKKGINDLWDLLNIADKGRQSKSLLYLIYNSQFLRGDHEISYALDLQWIKKKIEKLREEESNRFVQMFEKQTNYVGEDRALQGLLKKHNLGLWSQGNRDQQRYNEHTLTGTDAGFEDTETDHSGEITKDDELDKLIEEYAQDDCDSGDT